MGVDNGIDDNLGNVMDANHFRRRRRNVCDFVAACGL